MMSSRHIADRAAAALLSLGAIAACGSQRATAIDGVGASAGSLGAAGTNVGGSFGVGAAGSAGAGGTGAEFTLVVDTPVNNATVGGIVSVAGRARSFVNVEVWDDAHQHPPLAQVTPSSDGSFETTVDTAVLGAGPTTWTVWAWDSPPNQPYDRSETVELALTISGAPDGGPGTQTIGVGDINRPAVGPGPTEAGKIGGASFVLVKNWDFGTSGTIKDTSTLVSEFQFHDQFGTIANGTNYGAVIVAPSGPTAIQNQPVEDPARPTREWTAQAIRAHVRPLSATQITASVSAHNTGCGSIVAKWKLQNGGALLGRDLLWETRARILKPLPGYWLSFWAGGNKWDRGPEMDVVESFGTPNIYPPPSAFHVNSTGGNDAIDYASWPNGLSAAGVPEDARDLRNWHTWSWLYRVDDTYVVYYDGYVVQRGSIRWTLSGSAGGEELELYFIMDVGWGHLEIPDIDISLPAADFPITYELDYSRVYLR
jgi:hypothetical protein